MFKVNNKNTKVSSMVNCRQKCRSAVFIVNLEHISHLVLLFLLLILNNCNCRLGTR